MLLGWKWSLTFGWFSAWGSFCRFTPDLHPRYAATYNLPNVADETITTHHSTSQHLFCLMALILSRNWCNKLLLTQDCRPSDITLFNYFLQPRGITLIRWWLWYTWRADNRARRQWWSTFLGGGAWIRSSTSLIRITTLRHDEIYKWVRCDHGLTRLRLTQQRSRGDSLSDHGLN